MKTDLAIIQLNLVIQALYGQSFETRPDVENLENIFRINRAIASEDEDAGISVDERDENRALAIARGVYENREKLDGIIRGHLRGWKLERLGLLELLLLRTGIYLLTMERWREKGLQKTLAALAQAYGVERAISLIEGVLVSCHREMVAARETDEAKQD